MLIRQLQGKTRIDPIEIEIYLSHLLHKDRSFVKAFPEYNLNTRQTLNLRGFLKRRRNREPLPYILGYKDFFGLRFKVDKRVMIPRPETENLVDKAIKYATSPPFKGKQITIVDVGTGSGNIAISLAKNTPFAKILAIEKDKNALSLARENIRDHGVNNKIRLIWGNLLEPIKEGVDIVIANLPYIPSAKIKTLRPEISFWEPKIALDGGTSGTHLYRKLFKQAKNVLKPQGIVLYEIDGNIFSKKL